MSMLGESALDETYARMDHEKLEKVLSIIKEVIERNGSISDDEIFSVCLLHTDGDMVHGLELSVRVEKMLKPINGGDRFCLRK